MKCMTEYMNTITTLVTKIVALSFRNHSILYVQWNDRNCTDDVLSRHKTVATYSRSSLLYPCNLYDAPSNGPI